MVADIQYFLTFGVMLVSGVLIGQLAVGAHLLLVLVLDLGMQAPGQGLGRFAGGNAKGAAGGDVDKGGGDLAPVAKFQRAFSQATAGHYRNGVRSTAVNLDKSDQALAVPSLRIVDAEVLQAEHGQAHAEYLSRTEVAVSDFSVVEVILERFHGNTLQLPNDEHVGTASQAVQPGEAGQRFLMEAQKTPRTAVPT